MHSVTSVRLFTTTSHLDAATSSRHTHAISAIATTTRIPAFTMQASTSFPVITIAVVAACAKTVDTTQQAASVKSAKSCSIGRMGEVCMLRTFASVVIATDLDWMARPLTVKRFVVLNVFDDIARAFAYRLGVNARASFLLPVDDATSVKQDTSTCKPPTRPVAKRAAAILAARLQEPSLATPTSAHASANRT
jgi:hypothetical protein